MTGLLSKRMSRVKASAIREILKVTERPEILSFAGGLPAPELFPAEALARAHAEVFARDGAGALQYGPTEGFLPLRAWIADHLRARGVKAAPERLLITNGSQQGIDLVAKVLLDPGDTVLVEQPSYLAALQVFEGHEARFALVDSDAHGMRVDQLERVLRTHRPKLIYVVPTFQNPSGTTLPLERRQALVRVARDQDVTILEDDPYSELRYTGADIPPVAALEPAARTIYLGTFSKTLAPGLRIGWVSADAETTRALTIAKQAADLHTSSLTQRAVATLLETFDYPGHLARIRGVYGERCRVMVQALAELFPAGTRWTAPEGGLFLWVELPRGVDGARLLPEALRERVAFVPGAPFYAGEPRHDVIRLNFSNQPPEAIRRGMSRLAAALARCEGAQGLSESPSTASPG